MIAEEEAGVLSQLLLSDAENGNIDLVKDHFQY